MAAATVDSSIQRDICNSPLKVASNHSVTVSHETAQTASLSAEGSLLLKESSEMAQSEQDSPEAVPGMASDTEQTTESSPAEDPQAACPPSGETAGDSQPGSRTPDSVAGAGGGGGADSDSDDEPVSAVPARSRPRARRLALDSDEEEAPDGVPDGAAAPVAGEEVGTDDERQEDASPAPARGRVRHRALDSDEDEEEEEKADGAAEVGNDTVPAERGTDGEDSADEEQNRKEKNLKRLMALGDSSSDDDGPRPESPAMDVEDEDQREPVKSADKKKQQKKKGGRQKLEQEAAEQMRQIRSAAQRRTRESRLNLPYHRPRQRTLHEFLARRQRAPVLPEQLRISSTDADDITRRLEEKEKEIEEFYRPASDHEDGAGSDPEWTPKAAPAAARPPSPAPAPAPAPASAAAAATPAAAPAAPAADAEEEEEDKVISQSSQKVQEWLEGMQPAGDHAVIPPMTDAEQAMTARPAAGQEPTAAAEKAEPAPPAVDERPPEEARSVSADTETTSLAPGDSASEVNTRAAAAAAAAASAPTTASASAPTTATASAPTTAASAAAPAAAPPAARLARLAARLPQLGAVLGTTPRLRKSSEVVSLDDSDDDTPPEPTDLDKFVERFVRHSNAKPKKAEKKTVNISLVRLESDSAGGQQLVADSVPVTVTSGDPDEPADGPPGAQRQQLQRALMNSIRRQREQARQRREREYQLYNSEQVDDGYLDDLPDEEAEPSDVSSDSGESEPEEEPPLTETPRAARCPLLDDEAEQEDDDGEDGHGEDREDGDGEEDELKLVLEEDDDDLLGSPRRASVATEPELFCTQPSGRPSGDTASQAESQDSDQASSSLVTAHQPGGGFMLGGNQRATEEEARPATPGEHQDLPLTPALDTQPTGSFSLPLEDTQQFLGDSAAAAVDSEPGPDSLSQLGPLRLSPEPRSAAGRGPRSAIGALIDPAADESMDDLMSLCSGKFDAPGTGQTARVTRADTQPAVDLLSVPPPTNKDGVVTWSASAASQKLTDRRPSSEPLRGMSLMSTVDMFEDGNANMPLDVVSDGDDEPSDTQLIRQKKRRRRLVFSDDEDSGAEEPAAEDTASDEDAEDSGEDSAPVGRTDDASLPTDFTGFLGRDKKKMRAEFLDAEAELSGSDEPSEDEADGDELDRMDEEEADAEQIDEHKLREQVERIHQKKALDDDLREMKLFQERFLEDGDLHGRGRERKFRWSNADEAADDSNERPPSDDEADQDQDERDERWRLERHEREKWLQEHAQKGQDDEPEPERFTFLKPGQKVVRRLVSGGQRSEGAAPAAAARTASLPPPLPVSPRAVKVSRGSFLRRGKEALARLMTTARSLSMPAGTSSKNSSNRTFSVGKRQQSESEPDPEVELEFRQTVEEKTKRKAPSAPAEDAKRAKLSRSFSSLAEDSQSNSLFSVIL